MRRILGAFVLLLASGFGAADDKKPDPPKGEEVSGKVTLDGMPLTGATITFLSKDGKTKVDAEIKDGDYKATVPVGEYGVGIASVPPPKKNPKDPPKEEKILPVVPAKYNDPKTSGITAKVVAGKNELNFDLKSK